MEKAIWEHEWIGNLESDDDTPVSEGARSATRGDIGGWILKTSIKSTGGLALTAGELL